MIPFDLGEYLVNPQRRIETRDGRKAKILCTDLPGATPVVVAIYDYDGFAHVSSLYPDGSYFKNVPYDDDIVFVDGPNAIPCFKPYDKVLTREHREAQWKANLFSHYKMRGIDTIAVCVDGEYLLDNITEFDDELIGKI